MAYETANGVKDTDAVDYYEDAGGEPQARVDAILRRAERAVRDLTVRPVPESDEYKKRAADAEFAVFEYLFEHKPYLKRERLSDADVTYADDGALVNLVRDVLGGFFAPPASPHPPEGSAGVATVHNVSPEPLW